MSDLKPGDKIWYRRKGEVLIRLVYVVEVRNRVLSVSDERDRLMRSSWSGKPYWLDIEEIDMLEVERV